MTTQVSIWRRRVPLGTKLAAVTSGVLLVISMTLFVQLAARERTRLVAAKASAAAMLTQLLAMELGAVLDFGDNEDAATQLQHLRTNPDIVAVAVWSGKAAAPVAEWKTQAAPNFEGPAAGEPDGATVSPDWLVATRTVVNHTGLPLGRVRVVFTLAPENQAFRASRTRLLWTTAALTFATAGLLVLLARRFVLGPLGRLAEAAGMLAKGDLSARVEPRSNDEIGDLTRAFNVMGEAVAFRQERLKKEVDLARHIQSSILPRRLDVPGLEVVASMTAATEVGGDYYDVVPVNGGCWIGIGDVAGHGLDTGLIMLMTQAIVAALVKREPAAAPRDVVCMLNEVLFENIRNRLERYDHVTLTLLRYDRDGRVVFAGAHEDIIVYRADRGRCDVIETPGTWLGGRRDIAHATHDSTLELRPGDVLLLYTDGVTELRNAQGEAFGIERVCAELERLHALPVTGIQAGMSATLRDWGTVEDDVTLLIARFGAPSLQQPSA